MKSRMLLLLLPGLLATLAMPFPSRLSNADADSRPVIRSSGVANDISFDIVSAPSDSDDQYWDSVGSGFTAPMYPWVARLHVHDSELIAGGHFEEAGFVRAINIARWDGTNWDSLGSTNGGAFPRIADMLTYHGDLVARSGTMDSIGLWTWAVIRWDGSRWDTLGSTHSPSDGRMDAIAVYNGDLIVGGSLHNFEGITDADLFKFNGVHWTAIEDTLGRRCNGAVTGLLVYDGKLIIAGYVRHAFHAPWISTWDGLAWGSLGSGMNGPVRVLGEYKGDLIAGGTFDTADGVSCRNIARWNGTAWRPLGSGLDSSATGMLSVGSLAVYNGELFAGGTFTIAGGDSARFIARWDGRSWHSVGSGVTNIVSDLQEYNGELIVSGKFTTAGATPVRCIAAWGGPPADTDGDGLLDVWELQGFDADGDDVIDVDLPAMGADPLHKDIFVEVDWMEASSAEGKSHEFNSKARQLIVDMFADAPVMNPDSTTGINLHIDMGQGGAYIGGNAVPHDNDLNPVWTEFDAIKSVNFDASREQVFYYCLFAHQWDGTIAAGLARAIPGRDFIVSLGGWTSNPGTIYQQAGTFAHELGHCLGLMHGGIDDHNMKPNYLSIMSYAFQVGGVIVNGRNGHFDYARWALPSLNENSLDETVGLGGPPQVDPYGTIYVSDLGSGCKRYLIRRVNDPIDWDQDGSHSVTTLSLSVGGDELCQYIGGKNCCDTDLDVLLSFDDWSGINLLAEPTGTSAATRMLVVDELTEDVYLTFAILPGDMNDDKLHNASDIIELVNYVFKSGEAPDPVYRGDTQCEGDGSVTAADIVVLVNYIFKGGPYPCCQ